MSARTRSGYRIGCQQRDGPTCGVANQDRLVLPPRVQQADKEIRLRLDTVRAAAGPFPRHRRARGGATSGSL